MATIKGLWKEGKICFELTVKEIDLTNDIANIDSEMLKLLKILYTIQYTANTGRTPNTKTIYCGISIGHFYYTSKFRYDRFDIFAGNPAVMEDLQKLDIFKSINWESIELLKKFLTEKKRIPQNNEKYKNEKIFAIYNTYRSYDYEDYPPIVRKYFMKNRHKNYSFMKKLIHLLSVITQNGRVPLVEEFEYFNIDNFFAPYIPLLSKIGLIDSALANYIPPLNIEPDNQNKITFSEELELIIEEW